MSPAETYRRYCQAIAGERLPAALLDLDAVDHNVDSLASQLGGKRMRVASKSLRCPDLVDYVRDKLGSAFGGLMTYTAAESAFWAERGYHDLLLAYPTVQPCDTALVAKVNQGAADLAVIVDCDQHIQAHAAAAQAVGATTPMIVDLDVSLRPVPGVHLGVRRSPIRTAAQVVALAQRIADTAGASFKGIMAYDAQIAGVTDANPHTRAMNPLKRAIKRLSRGPVAGGRKQVVEALAEAGHHCAIVNGGGTGSLGWCATEPVLTEITAGSGFIDSQLFDYYQDLELSAAAYFALQVVRRPAPGMITCLGGGYIASGEAGSDRLPTPALPEGLSLLRLEGAGEVQTPLTVSTGDGPGLGQPIFFRHAKSGELAEHFNHYLAVRGSEITARFPTLRGLGHAFL